VPDNFKSIGEIFEKNPGLAAVRSTVKQSEVVIEFFNIFPEMRKVVKPVKVYKKILFISVENSILRSELKFNENLLISKVNGYFKEERIKGIRFQ
jgi:hypothetical protein